jgi:hypothetical protein
VYKDLFKGFLAHRNTLQVYKDNKLVFASDKEGLLPLLEYIDNLASSHQQVVVFDKIIGRAAALLCILANCAEIYSPLGSELAVEALNRHDIKHHLVEIVPYIKRMNQVDMCPMEKLSLDKDPGEFYETLIESTNNSEKAST